MSKSGQVPTKADTGGQRVPKSGGDNAGSGTKTPQKGAPTKKDTGKKTGA